MNRLRLGSHNLMVETGRYKKVAYCDRKCMRCNQGKVDDEHHLIFECDYIDRQQEKFKGLFADKELQEHQDKDLRLFLERNEKKENQMKLLKFVHYCMEKADEFVRADDEVSHKHRAAKTG